MPDSASGRRTVKYALPPNCVEQTLGVSFFDLSRISEWSSSTEDVLVANFFQEFYQLVAERLEPTQARIVKWIGDAGLAVFSPEDGEAAIFALCDLSDAVRSKAREYGLDTYLNVNIHVGPVIAGPFGPPGAERFDVIGKTVNIAARLGRRGVTLSQQAFRCLSKESRKRFQKITGPTNYRWSP